MHKYEYYHFLSAKEDITNGLEKLANGEKLAAEERDAAVDVFNMFIDFISNEGILENLDSLKDKIRLMIETKYLRE